jgi:hypothetical protein
MRLYYNDFDDTGKRADNNLLCKWKKVPLPAKMNCNINFPTSEKFFICGGFCKATIDEIFEEKNWKKPVIQPIILPTRC